MPLPSHVQIELTLQSMLVTGCMYQMSGSSDTAQTGIRYKVLLLIATSSAGFCFEYLSANTCIFPLFPPLWSADHLDLLGPWTRTALAQHRASADPRERTLYM